MPELPDGGTLAWIIGALIGVVIVGGAVAFALWYSGDQTDL